jgi:hypothetical protein
MDLWSWFFGGNDDRKIHNPSTVFDTPSDVVRDSTLSANEKSKALDAWEQDARQVMSASNEGMPGPAEGTDPDDHHQWDRSCERRKRLARSRITNQHTKAMEPLKGQQDSAACGLNVGKAGNVRVENIALVPQFMAAIDQTHRRRRSHHQE